jgi:mRNA interferase MazF
VTVGVVTRTIRNIPAEVLLGPEDGMGSRCVVNLDDILTVPKSCLTRRLTMLSGDKMAAVAKALTFALDLTL